MKPLEKQILSFARLRNTFTVQEIRALVASISPNTPDATILWRLYDMTYRGALRRIGRGKYAIPERGVFSFSPGEKLCGKARAVMKAFPYTAFCIWDIEILNSFSRHQFSTTFDIIEIEKVAVTSVQEFLEEYAPPCVLENSLQHVRYDDFNQRRYIVVKSLIGESPLEHYQDVPIPSIEKMIVDLYCGGPLFSFLQGNESLTIIETMMISYTINASTLIRYASRRGKKKEIQSIMSKFMAIDVK